MTTRSEDTAVGVRSRAINVGIHRLSILFRVSRSLTSLRVVRADSRTGLSGA